MAGLPSFPSLGGNTDPILGTGTTNPSTISFTPALPFDTIEMITAGNSSANPSAGPIDVCVGPGSSPTVVTTITAAQINVQGPLKFVVTVPAGSTIATIRHTTGGANYIISLVTRNSAIPSVECMGAAASGGTVQTIAVAPALGAQAYNTRTVLPVILDNAANTHNLVVINGWYNDNAGGRTQAQVEADHQTLITQILALPNTDVMFNNYTTLNPNSIPSATFTSWSQAIIGYYTSQSLPSFDMSAVLPNFAAANAAGYMGDANLHLSASGHLLCAQSMKACFDYALTL